MAENSGSRISVVVPTCDHVALLRDCLRSLVGQTRPALEIIVVDNGSTDATAAIVREEFPQVRLVTEPRPGVDLARNRGLAEARGDVVAFTDDDCLAPRGWLEALGDCFSDISVACAGGPTRPVWPLPPSQALLASRRALFCLGAVDFGPARKRLDPEQEFLIGANMAVRKSLVARDFCGPQSYSPLGVCGDDYELSRRLAREHGALYEPRAYVHHRMFPPKMAWPRLLIRIFYFAAGRARLGGRLKPKRGPAELLGWEGAVSAADALGHLYGRLAESRKLRIR